MSFLLSLILSVFALVPHAPPTGPAPGLSAVFEGWTYEHTAITHTGDPGLDHMLSNALHLWGIDSAITDGGSATVPDITINYGTEHPYIAWTNPWGAYPAAGTIDEANIIPSEKGKPICEILVNPVLAANFPGWQLPLVVMHEAGHCLGLNHVIDPRCVMFSVPESICGDDLAAMGVLYPRHIFHAAAADF